MTQELAKNRTKQSHKHTVAESHLKNHIK